MEEGACKRVSGDDLDCLRDAGVGAAATATGDVVGFGNAVGVASGDFGGSGAGGLRYL